MIFLLFLSNQLLVMPRQIIGSIGISTKVLQKISWNRPNLGPKSNKYEQLAHFDIMLKIPLLVKKGRQNRNN